MIALILLGVCGIVLTIIAIAVGEPLIAIIGIVLAVLSFLLILLGLVDMFQRLIALLMIIFGILLSLASYSYFENESKLAGFIVTPNVKTKNRQK